MDRLDVLRLFVRVVETGSFSKTAKSEGIGQPTVSKQIAGLERRLGAQLVRRTSRGLSLTEAGQDFYELAVRLLGDFDAAESRVGRGQVTPSGLVRVTVSPGFGRLYVVPRLPDFFNRFPDVSVDLNVSDGYANLVEEGIDVAIRIGHLADSSLSARRIGSMEAAMLATPAYLERHGIPSTPDDLKNHDCVTFMFHGAPRLWQFKGPDGPFTVEPKGRVRTNDAEHVRAALLSGLGLVQAPTWLLADEIESGAVTRLLDDYAPDLFPINAVTPAARRQPGKVRVFIDFLAQIFGRDPNLATR